MSRFSHVSLLARGMGYHLEARRSGDRDDRELSRVGLALLRQLMVRHGLATAGRALDYAVAPGFRRVVPRTPMFVVAPPRSGTTLLYSLLSGDPRFVGPKLYESLLPSVSLLKVIDVLAGRLADGRVGEAFARNQAETFNESDAIHRIRYDELEEDTPMFDRYMACPTALRCFPYAERLAPLMQLDDRPPSVRRAVMGGYYRAVQRLLHRAGPGHHYLAKNIASAGRIGCLLETFPDARMIHIVRHPYRVLPSAIRLFQVSNYLGLPPDERPEVPSDHRYWKVVGETVMDSFRRLLAWERRLPAERWLTLRFQDLVSDPMEAVRGVYAHFGMELTKEAEAGIAREAEEASRHRSGASHAPRLEDFGLTKEVVYEGLRDVFEAYGFEP